MPDLSFNATTGQLWVCGKLAAQLNAPQANPTQAQVGATPSPAPTTNQSATGHQQAAQQATANKVNPGEPLPWEREPTPEEEKRNLSGAMEWLALREERVKELAQLIDNGRGNRVIKTPHDVLTSGKLYLLWCDANPNVRKVTETYQGEAFTYEKPLARIPSVQGWAAFIGISGQAIQQWLLPNKEPAYREATETIIAEIQARQIEGGADGTYNAGIATRLAGLADKQEVEHTAPDNDPSVSTMPAAQTNRTYLHPNDTTGTGPRLTHEQWLLAREGKLPLPQEPIDVTPVSIEASDVSN